MDAELEKEYENMAELIEAWYGTTKESNLNVLYEHGHQEVFKNPQLLGLDEKKANHFERLRDFFAFFYENGGEIECVETDDF